MIENQQFYLLLLSNSFIQEHKEQASTPRFLLIKSFKAISLSECHRSQDKSACKLQIIFAGQDHTCSQTPFSNQKMRSAPIISLYGQQGWLHRRASLI